MHKKDNKELILDHYDHCVHIYFIDNTACMFIVATFKNKHYHTQGGVKHSQSFLHSGDTNIPGYFSPAFI